MNSNKSLPPGFTLLEVMITAVIISILAIIAIPSYSNYVQRSYLTEAFQSLSAFQLGMEQYYQDNGNYGVNTCAQTITATKHFSYACALVTGGQSYTATATANGTDGLTGYVFTIDQLANRKTTAFVNATVPAACWITRQGGGC